MKIFISKIYSKSTNKLIYKTMFIVLVQIFIQLEAVKFNFTNNYVLLATMSVSLFVITSVSPTVISSTSHSPLLS